MCFTCTHTQKAADTLMFVYKAGVLPDHYAQLCLESCTAQGLPATMHVVQVSCGLSQKVAIMLLSCYFNLGQSKHTCTRTHINSHMHIHTCACMHTYAYAHMHIYVHAHVHAYIYTRAHTHTYMNTYTTHTYTHVHTYTTHIHVHTHMHTSSGTSMKMGRRLHKGFSLLGREVSGVVLLSPRVCQCTLLGREAVCTYGTRQLKRGECIKRKAIV